MRQNHPERKPHWREYACECAGTFILCFVGLGAVVFDFGHGLPMEKIVPSSSLRLLITGLLFAGTGSLVALSPIGKLSGAHLNPSVTIAFWVRRKMHRADVLGYLCSQFLGAAMGSFAMAALWKGFASSVKFGMTLPGPSYGAPIAFGAELLMTWGYLTLILLFVSHATLARKTPLMNWIVVATLVWIEAPVSGTSLNAARSFGPAIVAGSWSYQWIYLVAPTLGGILGALSYSLMHKGKDLILTGKLFHAPEYPSLFKNVPNPTILSEQGVIVESKS